MKDVQTAIPQIAAFLVFFPLLWMSTCWLISRLSGWSSLARSFETDQPAVGETFFPASGRVRLFSSYQNCLKVSVSEEGVRVATVMFFKSGHRPLFFPWESVDRLEQRRNFFGSTSTLLVSARGRTWRIALFGGRLYASLAKYAAPHVD